MREMKDSGIEWIGKIPQDWIVSKLKYSNQFFNGDRGKNYPSGNDLVDEGVIFLTSNNLHEDILDTSYDISKYITDERYNILGGAKLRIDDIVFCLRGSVGNCSINKTETRGTVASSLMTIRPQKSNADYINYTLHSEVTYSQTRLFVNGSCAENLSAENVANYYFVEPPPAEQQRISTYLHSKCANINTIISDIQHEIELLQEYKQSVITEAVTKGLDKNVAMKDSGIDWIGDIPDHWNVIPLKYLLSNDIDNLRVGPFGSELKSSEYVDDGFWVYNQRTVLDNNLDDNDTFITEEKYNVMRAFHIRCEDILITTRGTIGKICRIPQKFNKGIIHPCIIKFRIDSKKILYPFLELVFNSSKIIQDQLIYKSNATTIDVIYGNTLKNLQIPFPPISEQKKIQIFLNDKCVKIDSILADKQKQLDTLTEYKKSLIYEYVTGKKEVPADA